MFKLRSFALTVFFFMIFVVTPQECRAQKSPIGPKIDCDAKLSLKNTPQNEIISAYLQNKPAYLTQLDALTQRKVTYLRSTREQQQNLILEILKSEGLKTSTVGPIGGLFESLEKSQSEILTEHVRELIQEHPNVVKTLALPKPTAQPERFVSFERAFKIILSAFKSKLGVRINQYKGIDTPFSRGWSLTLSLGDTPTHVHVVPFAGSEANVGNEFFLPFDFGHQTTKNFVMHLGLKKGQMLSLQDLRLMIIHLTIAVRTAVLDGVYSDPIDTLMGLSYAVADGLISDSDWLAESFFLSDTNKAHHIISQSYGQSFFESPEFKLQQLRKAWVDSFLASYPEPIASFKELQSILFSELKRAHLIPTNTPESDLTPEITFSWLSPPSFEPQPFHQTELGQRTRRYFGMWVAHQIALQKKSGFFWEPLKQALHAGSSTRSSQILAQTYLRCTPPKITPALSD